MILHADTHESIVIVLGLQTKSYFRDQEWLHCAFVSNVPIRFSPHWKCCEISKYIHGILNTAGGILLTLQNYVASRLYSRDFAIAVTRNYLNEEISSWPKIIIFLCWITRRKRACIGQINNCFCRPQFLYRLTTARYLDLKIYPRASLSWQRSFFITVRKIRVCWLQTKHFSVTWYRKGWGWFSSPAAAWICIGFPFYTRWLRI